jgi:hypothetical protein
LVEYLVCPRCAVNPRPTTFWVMPDDECDFEFFSKRKNKWS